MSPVINWPTLVATALTDLGGRRATVTGAALYGKIAELTRTQGGEFREFLNGVPLTFREFLERHGEVEIYTRPGSDMLVAFPGVAPPPAAAARTSLSRHRSDVYDAFTRIRPGSYYYVLDRDQFTAQPEEGSRAVPVPQISLDELSDQRRSFVQDLTDEGMRDGLTSALDFSPNPLASFHRTLSEYRLLRRWHEFNYTLLRKKIMSWAEENAIPVRDDWFSQRTDQETLESPQHMLAGIAEYMTDDEVRDLNIPFRAVEELLRSIPRRRRF